MPKKFIKIIILILFVFLFIFSAGYAGNSSKKSRPELKTFDINNDGMITRGEFKGKGKDFAKLDLNADGVISSDEIDQLKARFKSNIYPGGDKKLKNPFENGSYVVDIYDKEKSFNGKTVFADYHDLDKPKIVEVNMKGEITWEYKLPRYMKRYTNPGFDVEYIKKSDTFLFVLPIFGIFEVNRKGKIVWSYKTNKLSHDADRLDNGNTIYVYGGGDSKNDAQVIEIDKNGNVVWKWYASKYFDKYPYNEMYEDGFSHTNSVSRLSDGKTLVSLRNFDLVVLLDKMGKPISQISTSKEGSHPHEPELQENGNILLCLRAMPWDKVVEYDKNGSLIWEYSSPGLNITRDSDRLPNGNTLIVESRSILELTKDKEVVWRFYLKDLGSDKKYHSQRLYKAERF
ncbi:MAG: aryl-sulfate sulfotransferase [Pseudomonadota bacterium]